MRKYLIIIILSFCFLPVFSQNGIETELVVQEKNADFGGFVKYSENGKYLLSVAGEMKIWETNSGKLVRTLPVLPASDNDTYGEKDCVVDIHPSGKYVIFLENSTLYSEEKSIRILNVETSQTYYSVKLSGVKGKRVSVQFSPDGKHFIICSTAIFVYNFDTGKLEYKLEGGKEFTFGNAGFGSCPKFSKNSLYLCFKAYSNVSRKPCLVVWNLKSKKIVSKYIIGAYKKYAISPSGEFVAYSEDKNTIVWNVKTGNKVTEINMYSLFIEFTQDERNILLAGGGRQFVVCDIFTGTKLSVFTYSYNNNSIDPIRKIESLSVHPDGEKFVIGDTYTIYEKRVSDFSTVQKYPDIHFLLNKVVMNGDGFWFYSAQVEDSFIINKFSEKIQIPYKNATNLTFSQNRMFFRYLRNDNIAYYDFNTQKTVETGAIVETSSINTSWSKMSSNLKGNIICYEDTNGKITVWDVDNKKKLRSFYPKDNNIQAKQLELSPSGKFLMIQLDSDKTAILNISNGNIITKNSGITFIRFSPNDMYASIYEPTSDGKKYVLYAVSTWERIREIKTDISLKIDFSSDEQFYVELEEGLNGTVKLSFKDIRTGNLMKSVATKLPFTYSDTINLSADNRYVFVSQFQSGRVYCFSSDSGNLLTTTMADKYGDWLTYTPEGYFNGSEGGINKFVHLVNGMEVAELGQYAETLYRPDLVAAKLRGEDISSSAGFTLTEITLSGSAPELQFNNIPSNSSSRDIKINFSVTDTGGGIGDVYLKLNDKVIQLASASRKFELDGKVNSDNKNKNGKSVSFEHIISLQNGENTIEAYATNAAGKIESLHAVAKCSWQGKTEKPNLYVLAIGVNKYRDRSLWLNYAVPDATSIADSFKNVKGNLYQTVNVNSIFDENVTAIGISQAFDSLAAKVKADDVFIFYISGHGTTHTDGDYYFIPVDFRFRNSDSIPETAISKHFITENLSKIQAQKSLVMLDTCNSGAFISMGARGMAEKTAIDRLSRATGQATIAASSDSQCAMEGYEGHGIFTYVILEGLSGKADLNGDGFISLSELSSYAEEKVPDYSYSKWGYEQYPQIDLRKQANFPLVGK